MDDEELIRAASKVVAENGDASTSLLQRKLRIGFAKAASILEELEARDIVGPADGPGPRQVLVSSDGRRLMPAEVPAEQPISHSMPKTHESELKLQGIVGLMLVGLVVVGAFRLSVILGWIVILGFFYLLFAAIGA